MTLPFSLSAAPIAVSDFRLRAIEEAAGIDDGEVGIGVVAGEFVTLGAQPRDNALGIDQRLRTAERNEGDAGWPLHGKLRFWVLAW